MKSNLAELQEKMRLKANTLKVANQETKLNEEGRPICPNCKRRVCRKGSPFCSRCTAKAVTARLRNTLPGMEIETNEPQESKEVMLNDSCGTSPKAFFTGREITGDHGAVKTSDVTEETETKTTKNYYTRKQVAKILGVSTTSIFRWERKGKTPLPKKLAHSNQCLYTDELVEILKEFMKREVEIHTAIPRTPQEIAAKGVAKKTFKINKRLERAVSVRINQSNFRGGGKLVG